MTIQIDRQAEKVVKFEGGQDREFVDDLRFYQTQYDLLKSRSLAERVASDLNLGCRVGLSSSAIDLGVGKAAHADFLIGEHCDWTLRLKTRGILSREKPQRRAWYKVAYQLHQRLTRVW